MQSKKVAKKLNTIPLTQIYVSSATRCQQTFKEYKKINSDVPFTIIPELKEIYRVIVGGPPKEGTSLFREEQDRARIDAFFEKICVLPKNYSIALFIHGNVIRHFLAKSLNINPRAMWKKVLINSGSNSMIDVQDGLFYIRMLNNIEHLSLSERKKFYTEGVVEEEYFP